MRKFLKMAKLLKPFIHAGFSHVAPGSMLTNMVLVIYKYEKQNPRKRSVYGDSVKYIVIPLGFEPRTTTLKV